MTMHAIYRHLCKVANSADDRRRLDDIIRSVRSRANIAAVTRSSLCALLMPAPFLTIQSAPLCSIILLEKR